MLARLWALATEEAPQQHQPPAEAETPRHEGPEPPAPDAPSPPVGGLVKPGGPGEHEGEEEAAAEEGLLYHVAVEPVLDEPLDDAPPLAAREEAPRQTPLRERLLELVLVFLPAGVYGVGGYTSHFAIFYGLFEFKEFLALSVLVPGSVSSEFVALIGAYRAGALGAFVAVLCWVLPGFILFTLAGLGIIMKEAERSYYGLEGFVPATAVLVIIMAMRLGRNVVNEDDAHEKVFIAVAVAASSVLIETNPRIPVSTLYWVLPLQLLFGGLVNLAYDVVVRQRLRVQERRVLRELWQERNVLKRLQREVLYSCLGGSSVVVGDDDDLPASSGGSSGGGGGGGGSGSGSGSNNASTVIPDIPLPLLEQMTTTSSIIDIKARAARELREKIERSLDRQYHVFQVSPWYRVPVALALAGLLVGLALVPARWPQALEANAALRMFYGFFFHGFRTNGGPSELLPMLADMIGDTRIEGFDDQTVLKAFDLALFFPGPPFNVSAYFGAKALGLRGAFLAWLAFLPPGPLLLVAFAPLWSRIREREGAPAFMAGVATAALGVIMAFPRLYSIEKASDAIIVLIVMVVVGYLGLRGAVGILLGGLAGWLMSPKCLNIGQQKYGYTIHDGH